MTSYKERISLYRYGYSIIITFFLALVIIFNVAYLGILTLANYENLLFAIPYVFIVDFGLKLDLPTDNTEIANSQE